VEGVSDDSEPSEAVMTALGAKAVVSVEFFFFFKKTMVCNQ
jgi:hypothetical protein